MVKSFEDAYILGLWCADGYHRTSSIGLSNIDPELVRRFSKYLLKKFPAERLRLRVYVCDGDSADKALIREFISVSYLKAVKARHTAYHTYVNSRSLLREFIKERNERLKIEKDFILPYIAGRFDGDGSVAKDLKSDFRIAYGSYNDAECDKTLLQKTFPCAATVYTYKKARTYCLYVSQKDAPRLVKELLPYSSNLQAIGCLSRPVETEAFMAEIAN